MTRLTVIAFSTACLALAQDPPLRVISGIVLDAMSGSPLAHATVKAGCTIPRTLATGAEVLTDASGTFRFTGIPHSDEWPTICNVDAARNGYLPATIQSVGTDPVIVKLVPQSVITGIVLDEHRQPLPYADITTTRRVLRNGLYVEEAAGGARTDDQGRFRVIRLAAGSYRVCVKPPLVQHLSVNGMAYDGLCYSESSQDRLSLKAGEARELRFDFLPIRGVRLSGHIGNATSLPYLSLLRETQSGFELVAENHRWHPETSTFEFLGVLPSTYMLTAQTTGSSQMWARKTIKVDASGFEGLELSLAPDPEMEGSIRSDDESALTAGLSVEFEGDKPVSSQSAQVDPHGIFKLTPSPSNAYRVRISPLPWHVQSIKQAGRDITEGPLKPLSDGSWGKIEIVASKSHGLISGILQGNPEQAYQLFLLEERNRRYRIVTVTVSRGQWKFEFSMPPGEYLILATMNSAKLPFLEPSYLARERFVAKVRVAEGQTSNVEVRPVTEESDIGR